MYKCVCKCMCYNSWCACRHPQSLQLVLWLGTEGCDGGYRSAKELFFSLLVLALFVLNLLLDGTNKGVPWVYAVLRKPFFLVSSDKLCSGCKARSRQFAGPVHQAMQVLPLGGRAAGIPHLGTVGSDALSGSLTTIY